jgi:hypothetical protein
MPQGLNTEIQVGLEKSEEPLDFEPDGLGQVYFGNFTSPEVYFWSFPVNKYVLRNGPATWAVISFCLGPLETWEEPRRR